MKALLALCAALLIAGAAHADLFFLRPRWTRAKPHFETRLGRRIAVAAGTAKDANLFLARSTAEDRARAALLHLVKGKAPDSAAEGWVRGARTAKVYDAGGGRVYVRLEVDVTAAKAAAPTPGAPAGKGP